MGGNKRKGGAGAQDNGGKKAKVDVHKIGKYLPGGFPIDPKMKGVMVTCARGRETQAGKEACDLLSEYAQKLYGDKFNDEPEQDEDESIEDAIAREVAQAKKTKGGKKFLPLSTGTDCVIFIRAMDIEPSKLCHYVLSDLQKSGSKRTRYKKEMMSPGDDSVHWRSLANMPIRLNKYCMRFIPVDETSYANMEDIETMSERVFKPYFQAEDQNPTTFKIIPKIRHNDKVERDTLLKKLAGMAGQGQNHTVSMDDPEYIILAEVIKSICFMGVVRDYEKLKKYNIQSIFEAAQKSEEVPKGGDVKKDDDEKKEETTTSEAAPEEETASAT
ncbi:THUMP domain-containing protein 1 [Linnemannia hyalina]|uniref:THUMP domain-containing protein 1 n=1 Tax=Linnemannia hyalina TaxID=64524 RepID=A0A9P7XKD7_9FUNG|nr:THUMP domain-containing protein 1 [Linnemannia hyalina]